MTNSNEKVSIKCSNCKSRYYIEDYGVNRLGNAYKTCIKCRQRQANIRNTRKGSANAYEIKADETPADETELNDNVENANTDETQLHNIQVNDNIENTSKD